MLKTSGNYVRDDVVGTLIQLVSDSGTLQSYSVHLLWKQMTGDLHSKQPLTQVCLWVLGEYADLLSSPDPQLPESEPVSEDIVIDMCEKIISSNLMSVVTKEYTVSALMKLSVRLPACSPRTKSLIDFFGSHMNTELQQRSVEFSTLFNRHDTLRASLLERMPPMKPSERKINATQNGRVNPEVNGETDVFGLSSSPTNCTSNAKYDALVDIMGLDLNTSSPPVPGANLNKVSAISDVMGLFDELNVTSPSIIPSNPTPFLSSSSSPAMASIFNSSLPSEILDSQLTLDHLLHDPSAGAQSLSVFEKNGLKIAFDFEKDADSKLSSTIKMTAKNTSPFPMSDFLFQAAVPKVSRQLVLPF